MERNIKRILLFSVILFALSILFFSVNAVTIQETTNTNDAYDTIEKGTIIIGTTKFSPNTVITAKKAAIAGANDMKVFIAKGGNISKYTEPAIYYYVTTNSWYSVREDGNVEPTENISSIELYYVDNEPKTGIDSVTKEEIKIEEPKETATYTVTFMNDSEVFATQEVKEGEKAVLPTSNPTKEGYIFKGWLNIDFTKAVTENIVAVADWEQNYYTVTFMNDTSVYGDVIKVEKGKTVSRPTTDPSKTGYQFVDWYKDGTSFNFNTKINENTIITAEFKAITYTITIGAMENGIVTVPKSTAIYEDNIVITVTPNAGYVLKSLVVKDALENNVTVSTDKIFKMPNSNVTISAEFISYSNYIDTENDEAMQEFTNTVGSDDVFASMAYTKESNTATLVVNEDKKIELVINHSNEFINLVLEIAKEANSFHYEANGFTSSEINLTEKSSSAVKLQVAQILLKLVTGKTDATKITLEDIIGKTAIITLKFDYDVELTYTINISSISQKDVNNDSNITSIANGFTDSEHNALEISYNSGTNKVTLSMSAVNNNIKIIDYYDSLWDVVKTVATDANTISYRVGTTVGSDSNATQALKKIVKALLAETGNPVTEEAAEQLTFGEIVGSALNIQIDVDYGNDVVLTYTIDFVNT